MACFGVNVYFFCCLQAAPYDVLDADARAFDDDFYAFRAVIKDLERRLGAIIMQAFDDCTTVQARPLQSRLNVLKDTWHGHNCWPGATYRARAEGLKSLQMC
jgi:hypothetical protein